VNDAPPRADDGSNDAVRDIPESRYGRRILNALRRIIRSVDLYSRKLVAEYQITGPQLVCLNSIVELGPITATDLAYHVHLSPSTVVRILDRLESKGLIQRQRQKDDRRFVLVTATIAGHELSAKAPYSGRHPLRYALQQLPFEKQEIVTDLLENLVNLMDAHELSTSPVLEVGSLQKPSQADESFTDQETEQDEASKPEDA
jgi:DNA-binding MarR family transcriptional regulator